MSIPRDADPQALCYRVDPTPIKGDTSALVRERLICHNVGMPHDIAWFDLEDSLIGNISLNQLPHWYLTPEEAITAFSHELMDEVIATTLRLQEKTRAHFDKGKKRK